MKHIVTFKLFDGSKMVFICDCNDRNTAINNAVAYSRKVFNKKKFIISRKTEVLDCERWNKTERTLNSVNGSHNYSVALITRDGCAMDDVRADGIKSVYTLVKQSVGLNYEPMMFIYDTSQMNKMRCAVEKARFTLSDRQRIHGMIDSFVVAIKKLPLDGTFIAKGVADLMLFEQLINDVAIGVYKDIPVNSIVTITVVILYFVSPINLSFEAVPVVGQMDDIALAAFILDAIGKDVAKYDTWRKQNKIGSNKAS